MEQATTLAAHIARRLGSYGLMVVIVLIALAAALVVGFVADLAPAATDPVLAAPIRWMV